VPILGPGNALVGALSISGPRYRIEAAGEATLVPVLFKYAKELTRTVGGNPDDPSFFGWNQSKASLKRQRLASPLPTKPRLARARQG